MRLIRSLRPGFGPLRSCGAVIIVALVAFSTAQACGIDGAPSALVDHQRVLRNKTTPTLQTWKQWAPFVAVSPFRTGQTIPFAEDLPLLRRTIPASFISQPWRWTFGDGTTIQGWNVSHRFTRPGTYRILVATFERSERSWFLLDTIGVRVTE